MTPSQSNCVSLMMNTCSSTRPSKLFRLAQGYRVGEVPILLVWRQRSLCRRKTVVTESEVVASK